MKDIKVSKVTPEEVNLNPWDVKNYTKNGIYLTDEGLMFVNKDKLVVKYICSVEEAEKINYPVNQIGWLELAVIAGLLAGIIGIIIMTI